jgi:hypothetical protein
MDSNFKLKNPKRPHHFHFEGSEYLSLQVNVGATELMNEEAKAYYKQAADPVTGLQSLEEGKDQIGVYELSWSADDWPLVNLNKPLNPSCSQTLFGIFAGT